MRTKRLKTALRKKRHAPGDKILPRIALFIALVTGCTAIFYGSAKAQTVPLASTKCCPCKWGCCYCASGSNVTTAIASNQDAQMAELGTKTAKEAAQKTLKDYFNDAFDFFVENFDKIYRSLEPAVTTTVSGMKSKVDYLLQENMFRFKTELEQAKLKTEIVAQTSPSMNNTVYCNTIIANLGPVAMFWFALAVENAIIQSIDTLFVDVGSDGVGPEYSRYMMKLSCPDSSDPLFKTQAKTMNPLVSPPTECIADNEDMTDAGVSTKFFSGRDETALELPPLVTAEYTMPDGTKKTHTIPIPDPVLDVSDDDKIGAQSQEKFMAQQAFMQAVAYCIRTAGPRPTPPGGDAVFTGPGMTYMIRWEQCSARRSMLIKQCAKMVAKHTRPDCRVEVFEKVCRASTLACEAAKSLNSEIPFSCKYPMSRYQAEMASRMACLGRSKTLWEANDKQKNGAAVAKHAECALDFQKWKADQESQMQAFTEAMDELKNLWKCWPRDIVSPGMGNKTGRAFPPKSGSVSSTTTGTTSTIGTGTTGPGTGTTGPGTGTTVPGTGTSSGYPSSITSLAEAYAKVGSYYGVNSECASLTKAFAPEVGAASGWSPAEAVYGNTSIPIGTPVATFIDGSYGPAGSPGGKSGYSHTGIYLGQTAQGMIILDQWNGSGGAKVRTIPWSGSSFVNSASNYSVIAKK